MEEKYTRMNTWFKLPSRRIYIWIYCQGTDTNIVKNQIDYILINIRYKSSILVLMCKYNWWRKVLYEQSSIETQQIYNKRLKMESNKEKWLESQCAEIEKLVKKHDNYNLYKSWQHQQNIIYSIGCLYKIYWRTIPAESNKWNEGTTRNWQDGNITFWSWTCDSIKKLTRWQYYHLNKNMSYNMQNLAKRVVRTKLMWNWWNNWRMTRFKRLPIGLSNLQYWHNTNWLAKLR